MRGSGRPVRPMLTKNDELRLVTDVSTKVEQYVEPEAVEQLALDAVAERLHLPSGMAVEDWKRAVLAAKGFRADGTPETAEIAKPFPPNVVAWLEDFTREIARREDERVIFQHAQDPNAHKGTAKGKPRGEQ